MALNELKKIEKPIDPPCEETEAESLYRRMYELTNLRPETDNEDSFEHLYNYRGKTVKVKGIPMDFRIYLDGILVCEVVMDQIYNEDITLVKELLD